jgi:hypothetical protein
MVIMVPISSAHAKTQKAPISRHTQMPLQAVTRTYNQQR